MLAQPSEFVEEAGHQNHATQNHATQNHATNKAISPSILSSNAEEADERGTAKFAKMIYHVTASVKEVSFVVNDLQMSSVRSLIIFV